MTPSFRPTIVSRIALASALSFGALPAALAQSGTSAVPYKPLGVAQSVMTEDAGPVAIEIIAGGLVHPWGMDFLPDGRILVTERNTGKLLLVNEDGTLSSAIEGVPQVFAQGQGGLLDVAVDPDFEENRYVYLTYAEADEDGASTALGRGKLMEADGPTLSGRAQTGENALRDDPPYAGAGVLDPVGPFRLEGFERLFSQEPKVPGPNHFGSRIVFNGDGTLFLTLGERFKFEPAQELTNHLGALVRLNKDGSVPDDNPFVGVADARDEIFSFGHRNIQAAALQPDTGQLFVAEMGPLGGDELNAPEAGRNYGWPLVSWGINYDGSDIPDPTTRPELADAVKEWTPTIAPSGMAFYTGDAFPDWQGSALIGSLVDGAVVRVEFEGGEPGDEERIPVGARVRDVVQGPDGLVYLLTDQDEGNIWRLAPLPTSGG